MLIGCAFSIYLVKKEVNMAGMSIGLDYLQTLSMFSNFSFEWPTVIHSIYAGVSMASMNLELLATECK